MKSVIWKMNPNVIFLLLGFCSKHSHIYSLVLQKSNSNLKNDLLPRQNWIYDTVFPHTIKHADSDLFYEA